MKRKIVGIIIFMMLMGTTIIPNINGINNIIDDNDFFLNDLQMIGNLNLENFS